MKDSISRLFGFRYLRQLPILASLEVGLRVARYSEPNKIQQDILQQHNTKAGQNKKECKGMKNKTSSRWLAHLLIAIATVGISLSLVSSARAQSTTEGAIGGTVFDQSGAVIPDASVTAHDNGTNADHTVTTDASGSFRIVNLNPAVYTVTVIAKGFETFKDEQITVTVGSISTVLPHLTVGATAQTVTVTGAAAQVNTNSADFAHTLNQTAISSLPIQRPRWSNFALLTPGVVSQLRRLRPAEFPRLGRGCEQQYH